jgi:hypothetical protein
MYRTCLKMERNRNSEEKFEDIFHLYLRKSRELLLANRESILQQIEKVLRGEIEKRGWQVDEEKIRTYCEITASFYEEGLWEIDYLIERRERKGSFEISEETLQSLYRFEKAHLGYSFEEESRSVGRDITELMEEGVTVEEAAEFLLKKYAVITTSTILGLDKALTPNHLPDFVLARIKRRIVNYYFLRKDTREGNK